MRATLLLIVALTFTTGCKTAEFALTHPGTGMHFVAKLQAQEPTDSYVEASQTAPPAVATMEGAGDATAGDTLYR